VSPAPVGLDELPPVCEWPVVELDGERWHVAPVYLAPVSRGEAVALADDWGCEVPSRALVDAIWQAADLRLDPHRITRDWSSPRDMVAYGAQRMRIEAAIGGRPFEILAGSHKDLAYVDAHRLALSQAAAHATTALDALLAVSPLALEAAERAIPPPRPPAAPAARLMAPRPSEVGPPAIAP
jgi:hypothetical protein